MPMTAKQRLYLTADRKTLVAAGDKRAATLYCVPGDTIPDSAVERFKLVDGGLTGGSKEGRGGSNKEREPGEDKGGNGGTGGGAKAPQPDDLTKLKGVGAKTAEVLVKAALTSFAAIAAVDPASPPAVEGLSPTFDWAKVKADAAELAGAGAQG